MGEMLFRRRDPMDKSLDYQVLLKVSIWFLMALIFVLGFFLEWIEISYIAVPLFLFFMFEIWFLVPLPKGPIETALGY